VSAIQWRKLDQPAFDTMVEAFYMSDNRDIPVDAYAVNGRGGDDGIDIHIRRDGRLTIVQLKFFPEGFSGGFKKTRQDQILASYKSAMKHKPDEWHLVLPTTATPSERAFVNGLRGRHSHDPDKIVVVGSDGLNVLAARHPDLVAYFDRDNLLEAAKVYNQERAVFGGGRHDLLHRVSALAIQANSLDPDWRLDFFSDGDLVGTKLVAKNPLAAERSPVTVTLTASFGPDEEELRRSFEESYSYGTPGRISLPPSVVTSFVVDGPEFIAHRSENVEVQWSAGEGNQESVAVSLLFRDTDGNLLSSFDGDSTWRNSAAHGSSLHAVFHDSITLEFLLPHDSTDVVSARVKIALGGSSPTDVAASIDLLEFLADAPDLTVEVDGNQYARLENNGEGVSPFGENREEFLQHREVANDLVIVQLATKRRFRYPQEVTFEELVNLRCLRLMLEGACVVLPGRRQVKPTLSGSDSEPLRKLMSGEFVRLAAEIDDYGQAVFGHAVRIGKVRVYAPQVRALNPGPALAALTAGTLKDHELVIRTRDGYGFWAYMPDLVQEGAEISPMSLGIEGFPDAADVARGLETVREAPALD
jgi:hypothetical protein